MITLTAEIVCDTCKQVVASSEPISGNNGALIERVNWLHATLDSATAKALRRGAYITPPLLSDAGTIVICANCLAKSPKSALAKQVRDAINKAEAP